MRAHGDFETGFLGPDLLFADAGPFGLGDSLGCCVPEPRGDSGDRCECCPTDPSWPVGGTFGFLVFPDAWTSRSSGGSGGLGSSSKAWGASPMSGTWRSHGRRGPRPVTAWDPSSFHRRRLLAATGDLLLHPEHIVQYTVILLGPQMLVRGSVDELCRHAQTIPRSSHTPFEDIAHV